MIFKIIERFILFLYKILGFGYRSGSIKNEVKSVKKLIVEGKFFVDCGGNIGNYSSEILRVFPNSNLHIFEPSKYNIQILNSKFKNKKNVIINGEGLSNVNDESTLFSDKSGSGLGSLTKRRLDHFNIDFDYNEKIKLVRLDEYWNENIKSEYIDLLKIDVEGHEIQVLEGLGEKINNVRSIQFEFGGCNIDTKTYFQDFWYFFKNHNFTIFRISPLGIIEINKYKELYESFTTTNFICTNNNL